MKKYKSILFLILTILLIQFIVNINNNPNKNFIPIEEAKPLYQCGLNIDFSNKLVSLKDDIKGYIITPSYSEHGHLSISDPTIVSGDYKVYFYPDDEYSVYCITIDEEQLSEAEIRQCNINGYYEFKNLSNNHTIDVEFRKVTHNITYILNGGTLTNPSYTFIYGKEFILPIPEKDGYQFMGWSKDETNIKKIITNIDKFENSDITLYAVFITKDYEIKNDTLVYSYNDIHLDLYPYLLIALNNNYNLQVSFPNYMTIYIDKQYIEECFYSDSTMITVSRTVIIKDITGSETDYFVVPKSTNPVWENLIVTIKNKWIYPLVTLKVTSNVFYNQVNLNTIEFRNTSKSITMVLDNTYLIVLVCLILVFSLLIILAREYDKRHPHKKKQKNKE